MGDQVTEPVIGCFPCIKRLMIVIMVGTIVTGILIISARNDEANWGKIVNSKAPFPSADLSKANHTFFVKKFVITKDNGSNSENKDIQDAWKLLGPRNETQKLLSIIALMIFVVFALGHFTGFCCCRERCFSRWQFRIITYCVYMLGFFIFIGIVAGIYLYQLKSDANYRSVANQLKKIKPPQFLYLGTTIDISTNNNSGELSSEDLEKITIMCYSNALLTLWDMIDFRHVYPQASPQHRVMKIDEEYYHTNDFVQLGFCQKDMLTVTTIAASVFTGLVCILLPLIGCNQLNRRRIVKVHPAEMTEEDHLLESIRSEVPPDNNNNP